MKRGKNIRGISPIISTVLLIMIVIILAIIILLTGCTDYTETPHVDGTIENTTDQPIYVNFVNDGTGEDWNVNVKAETSRSYQLTVGKYYLSAWWGGESNYGKPVIDTAELNLQPTDNAFIIQIATSSLTAWTT